MSKKILIVEDDTFLQGLAANKLTAAGFDVTTASNGDEAMTELAKGKFDGLTNKTAMDRLRF